MAAIFTTPKAQALRFIDKNERTNQQTYDNRFADQLKYPHTLPLNFKQRFLNTDPLWCHFRTNYTGITAYLVLETESTSTRTDITGDLIEVYEDSSERKYYNLPIDLSGLDGCYFIEFVVSDVDKPLNTIQSELFHVVEEMPNSVLIEWFGNDAYDDKMHWTDLKQFVRIDGSDRNLSPDQSKSIYENSDYAPITLKSKPLRKLELIINKVPYWVIEKINIALNHDDFYCNTVQYNGEDVIEPTILGDTQLYSGTVLVTQLDFENGEDTEISGEIEQSFIAFNDSGDRMLFNDSGDYGLAN